MPTPSRARTLKILAAIPKAVRERVRPVIEASAEELVGMQKRLVPTRRGKLRDSIRHEMGSVSLASSGMLAGSSGRRGKGSRFGGSAGGTIEGDPDLTATVLAGDRDAFYARFVEFGTAPHDLRKGGAVVAWRMVTRSGRTFAQRYRRQTKLVGAKRHPGSRARAFFYGPFRVLRRKIKSRVSRAIGRAVKEVVGR